MAWSGPPPSLSCMPCAGSARCLGGPQVVSSGVAPPPSPACRALVAHAAQGVPPPPPPGSGIPPLPSLTYRTLGAHAAVQGGPPLPPGSACTRWVRAAYTPPSPARARVARAAGAGGPPLHPGPGRAGGSRTAVFGGPMLLCLGIPPCARCMPWVCAARWGVPLPLPPLGGRTR